jgi:hypothetical protein
LYVDVDVDVDVGEGGGESDWDRVCAYQAIVCGAVQMFGDVLWTVVGVRGGAGGKT